MQDSEKFPLRGVIGVIANAADEVDLAVSKGLQCVEIRADQLQDAGHALDDIWSILRQASTAGLATLVTFRHPEHGGKFKGTELERVELNRRALAEGADMIDVEWDLAAAGPLLAENAPLILSYHNFASMPSDAELASLTKTMLTGRPRAIKVVPTASSLADAARMLEWVQQCDNTGVRRIGFAMSEVGSISRVMTIACGAPISYATFGEINAPGQIDIDELVGVYRAMQLNANTSLVAVVGDDERQSRKVHELNRQYAATNSNRIAFRFPTTALAELEALADVLRVGEIVSPVG